MKTFFILFGLLAAVTTINASTNPANPNQDKPFRLYVESYSSDLVHNDHQREDSYDDHGNYAYDYEDYLWWQDDRHWEISNNWFDGKGGNGEQIQNEVSASNYGAGTNDSHSDYFWPASSWPNVADGTVTMTGYGSDDYDQTIGSPVVLEHCDLGVPLVDLTDDALLPPDIWNGTWLQMDIKWRESRHADAVMKLQVGGKAKSQRQNLVVFNGSATRVVPVRDPYYHNPNQYVQSIPIPPQSIKVLGNKTLGSDGNLYVVLPDGDEEVVTPTVSGVNDYTFGLSATPYTPVIAARGNGINYDDISVTNPEFCVGQQLTFWMNWSPPNVANATYFWHLPDKFVNQATNYSPSCTTYVKNTDLLTNATTQCWYVRDPGGACSVREILYFSNGQSVNIAAAGNFTIYRPSVQFTPITTGTPTISDSGQTFPQTIIENGGILFQATITSTDFSGNANWVQLINRSVEGDWPGYVNLSTYGNYCLDNDLFYNTQGGLPGTPSVNTPVTSGSTTVVTFGTDTGNGTGSGDEPGVGCYPFVVSITDSFKTYLVFKPVGDGIWVTLGRVTWGWSAYAVVDADGTGDLIDSSTNAPTYTDTDEFPLWSSIYRNSK
jgi:hypothetical protein